MCVSEMGCHYHEAQDLLKLITSLDKNVFQRGTRAESMQKTAVSVVRKQTRALAEIENMKAERKNETRWKR